MEILGKSDNTQVADYGNPFKRQCFKHQKDSLQRINNMACGPQNTRVNLKD